MKNMYNTLSVSPQDTLLCVRANQCIGPTSKYLVPTPKVVVMDWVTRSDASVLVVRRSDAFVC